MTFSMFYGDDLRSDFHGLDFSLIHEWMNWFLARNIKINSSDAKTEIGFQIVVHWLSLNAFNLFFFSAI